MGRKSNTKAKEKKLKHKQELSNLAAKLAVIDRANNQEDPLSALQPFKKFERNGLNLSISCQKVTSLDKDTCEWAFELTKSNMKEMYESSGWGWNDKQKREEMEDEKAWYMIATDNQTSKPIAMVHFRFDLNDNQEVIYCYEIQLCKTSRRKGLGKFLMQTLELMAHKTNMTKILATVFKKNVEAQQFFRTKLKYDLDESDPSEPGLEEEFSYEILSKKINQKPTTQPVIPDCHSCCGHHHH